jgi:diguanylate cyclase (GGDEF)-like protein
MQLFSRFPLVSNIRSRFGSLGYFTPALLAFLAVGFMVVRIDLDEQHETEENLRLSTSQHLARIASNLETNINGNVKLVQGLVAEISAEPDTDQARFERLCESLFKEKSQLRKIVGAPDLVVSLIYPVAPNIKSLGLHYRKNAEQRDSAMQARDSKAPVLTGPINLAQGGNGLIARYPVFTRDRDGAERFWGIVSAVMDVDRLYSASGFYAPDMPIEVAIARESQTAGTDVFFGDSKLFDRSPVTISVDLGYDTWKLVAVPKGGWTVTQSVLRLSRLYSLFIALFIVGPLIWAGHLMKQRQLNILALQEREDELETLSHRLQLALEASKIGVWEFDETTDELIWDARMRELYSVTPGKRRCCYEDWRSTLHPDDLEEAEAAFAEALADETNYITQFRILTPSGEVRHIRSYGVTYRSSVGHKRIVGANWNVTNDVRLQTELREAHAHAEVQNRRLAEASRTLAHQSVHDALTGLPNRRYLDQYLEQSNPAERHAFLHVDLDRFKEVNDTLGHGAGDEVLQTSASRLLAVLDEGEFAARIGGDEFIIVVSSDDPEARSQHLVDRIHEAFSRPIMAGGSECRIGASIGVATQMLADGDIRQLLINSDIALYEAKKLGRNRAEFFTEALRLSTVTAKRTADELLQGLENDEIVPFFQPQFDATTLEIVGVEALARWHHPTRGLLGPDKFLAVAERLHRVADIDAIILEKSLFQATRWSANDLAVPRVSVNISAQRLRDERLVQRLAELAIPPGSLSFELLESISFDEHDEDLAAAIRTIRSFGIDVEIDDFGTGHASIVSLLELAPQRLKIDRKLICPIVDSAQQQRLVSSIIDIGRSLGIEIIAEGVETMAHAMVLRDLGCHTLQGYAFARPMPANEFLDFLRTRAQTNETIIHADVRRAGHS